MPPLSNKPLAKMVQPARMVNRGPAGLLSKLKKPEGHKALEKAERPASHNKINEGLLAPELVDVNILIPDPVNARLHPERNMEAIKDSLAQFGQRKPIVVNKRTNIVEAGNGTLQAAKELGWDRVAVNWVDDNPVDAIAFGLADNRSAELAKWDFEVVAKLDILMQAEKRTPIGWSDDEIEVIREADWTKPAVSSGGDAYIPEKEKLSINFTEAQKEMVDRAIDKVHDMILRADSDPITDADALAYICANWMGEVE